ncbi:MAG: CRISPR-associated protein Cas4 [Clostridia bacterium]|nr:CRISPR-associated protein Cas4 [Clostridia bacterium]
MDEWEPIPLSRLAHAGYCLRRAALLTNEQLWQESADTAKGRKEHERVHAERVERRGEQVLLYEYQVYSRCLNIGGKCDCIEAIQNPHGCRIPAVEFPVRLYPVEYKHGKLRDEEEYELQLCAQAMCLEEMYDTEIAEGAIFYISTHRRKLVAFTPELRQKVTETVRMLEDIRRNFTIPAAQSGPKCVRCSLRALCMPDAARSAKAYCRRLQQEAVKEDVS